MLIERALLAAACAGLLLTGGCSETQVDVIELPTETSASPEGGEVVAVELDDVTKAVEDIDAASVALPEVRYYRLNDS